MVPVAARHVRQAGPWLEARPSTVVSYDGGDAGIVWEDQSKNANDGVNSGLYPPVYEPAAVNGHDAVHFNEKGSAVVITDAPTLQFGTDQFFIAVVARTTTGSSYFFSKATTSPTGFGEVYKEGLEFFTDSNVEDDAGDTLYDDAGIAFNAPTVHLDNATGDQLSWLGTGFEDNAYHVVVLFRQSARLVSLSVDSLPAQVLPVAMTNVSEVGTDVTIGTVPYGSFRPALDMSVAEMLVVHSSIGVVENADIAAVRAYLQKKYGL